MRTRRLTARLLAIASLLGLLSASASAAPTVGIRFTSTTGSGTVGGSTIEARPGDLVTAVVSVEPDAAGVSSYVLSFAYDAGGIDGLDLVSATELLDPSFQLNLDADCASTQESEAAQPGLVRSCEAATLVDGPVSPASVDVAELVFEVKQQICGDQVDVSAGFFSAGIDGMYDNAGNPLAPSFGTATLLPEPGVEGLLVGMSLLGWLGRRRRSARS